MIFQGFCILSHTIWVFASEHKVTWENAKLLISALFIPKNVLIALVNTVSDCKVKHIASWDSFTFILLYTAHLGESSMCAIHTEDLHPAYSIGSIVVCHSEHTLGEVYSINPLETGNKPIYQGPPLIPAHITSQPIAAVADLSLFPPWCCRCSFALRSSLRLCCRHNSSPTENRSPCTDFKMVPKYERWRLLQ